MALKHRTFQGTGGPRLLITGGVHGDEFEPIAAIRRLIGLFDESSGLTEQLKGTLRLVPVVNEAAFLRGHRCAGEDGLDLARTCPGDPEGTVTDQAASAVSDLIREADAYIDLHTGGTELAVWPLSGYQLVLDKAILETQRRMARDFNLPFVWGTSASVEGRTLSVARDAGVPAIYTEYLGSATMDQDGVNALVEGCLNVMGTLGMIERKVVSSRVEHFVEDPREGSGHMQACNPSPMTGFFEPAVDLGQTIEPGQLVGTVSSFLGDEKCEIKAEAGGIVLVLRTFPRVKKGDTLGVIVELEP